GYFEGEFNGLDIAVKDSKQSPNTPNNWAYYNFNHSKPPYAEVAVAQAKANCSSCHEANAGPAADYTFTKYYPKAQHALAKLKAKDKPKEPGMSPGK
ncbi:MAG: cytochrome P460 family protein, partial [Phycisphaerales bacterium]|nr:cytochrome P460 family protein [Phycisphaerales bacterium]